MKRISIINNIDRNQDYIQNSCKYHSESCRDINLLMVSDKSPKESLESLRK